VTEGRKVGHTRYAVTSLPRRSSTFRALGFFAGASVALAALLASCGRVDTPPTGAGAGSDGGATSEMSTPPPADAAAGLEDALAVDVATPLPPDGGPPPVVACAGAGDGGVVCPLPPSACIDDHWLRFYTGGECEAGTCIYGTAEYQCPVSPIQPDCADGGCRITPVLR
jgi:hypothetical protein